MLAISALDVAFVGSLAALAAAFLTPLTGWLTTRETHRHERQIAHDARIFDLRREVYEAAVVHSHEGLVVARDLYQRLADHNYQPPPIEAMSSLHEVIRIGGKVGAVSSDGLAAAVDASATASMNFFGMYRDLMSALVAQGRAPTHVELASLKTVLDEVNKARENLATMARDEPTAPPK